MKFTYRYKSRSTAEGCIALFFTIWIVGALVCACYAIAGFVLSWAWNTALVPFFHLQPINFWIAVAFWVVLSIAMSIIRDISKAIQGKS